jgi:hypothetical protein
MKDLLNRKISIKQAILFALLLSFLLNWSDVKKGFVDGWNSVEYDQKNKI